MVVVEIKKQMKRRAEDEDDWVPNKAYCNQTTAAHASIWQSMITDFSAHFAKEYQMPPATSGGAA